MPNWLLVLLLISSGFILFLLELLTPGFGLAGIAGILLLIIGCFIAYIKLNLIWGILVSLGSLILIIIAFKVFARSPLWRKIRLDTQEAKDKGFSTPDFSELLNQEGITLSVLRPSGTALIAGKHISVTAEGLFIDKGKRIKVIKVEGSNIVVKEIT